MTWFAVHRRRIGWWLATITWLVVLALTLYPFRFDLDVASPSRIDWRLYYPRHSSRDLILNLLMMVPIGCGIALVRFGRVSRLRIALEAAAISLGTAVLIETLQIFERARYPQLADVWRNGAGCIAAAVASTFVLRWITARSSTAR